jgi:hypothetical protein
VDEQHLGQAGDERARALARLGQLGGETADVLAPVGGRSEPCLGDVNGRWKRGEQRVIRRGELEFAAQDPGTVRPAARLQLARERSR